VKILKILKWVFLALWAVDIVIFLIGQGMAPTNYHLIPGNPWGALFGTTFVTGVIFFCLAIFFAIIQPKSKPIKEKPKKNKNIINRTEKKYDLSFKRILSRVFLTGVVGIIFGISMFPFLTVADGLLYQQRAVIGSQNMIKMVALWGIFTLIVSLFAFWKKHFRMVSILLVGCWVFSIAFLVFLNVNDKNSLRCNRVTPFEMPSEFNRALDLVVQRMGVDQEKANGTILQSAFNYRNCLDIQYSDTNNGEVEAYFEYPVDDNSKNLQDLKIKVNPSYKNFDDLTLATLLTHEIIHAGEYINEVRSEDKSSLDCFTKEAKSFVTQHAFLMSLNAEEQRSINARLRENASKNPTLQILLLTSQRGNESSKACSDLQKRNNLTTEQTNKCSWEGLESKLLQDIKENSYYQKQCGN
jgi:hypothetical protein